MTEKELIKQSQQVLIRCQAVIDDYLTGALCAAAEIDESGRCGQLDYDVRDAIRSIDRWEYKETRKNEQAQS